MEYSQYNDFNRYQNLDGISAKIVEHLVASQSKHAQMFWKILKYNELNALSKKNLTQSERKDLIFHDNGQTTDKRVFFAPFIDDAWQEQCSSVYIYVDKIYPVDHLKSIVGIKVEVVVHSKISTINGDGDMELNSDANPNDSDKEGNIVVAFKNRATVLLKCVLAELNGLYLDGIGYLQLNTRLLSDSQAQSNLWNRRAFWGYSVQFAMMLSGVSDSPQHSK